MAAMLEIDGSMGEGGGQVLRSALALSCITGRPFRMTAIRGGRKKPGLAAQHQTCVRAAARISGAKVSGDEARSTELSFRPKRAKAGTYRFGVRTAGSASLVAQTVTVPLALAGGDSRVTVTGGTHVPWSPTAGYLSEVWCPAAGALGLRASAEMTRAGYYPKGGGELKLSVRGRGRAAMPLDAVQRGSLRHLRAAVTISRLDRGIARRCRGRAEELLTASGLFADWQELHPPAASPGVCVELVADFGVLSAGFSSIGRRGRPAEELAEEAVGALTGFLSSGAAVDMHLADQLVLPLAVTPGASRFATERITSHLLTVVDLVSAFLPEVRIAVDGEKGGAGTVRVSGGGG
ncbi:MAG: RNA 3'-terminal phosphate cyclase [Planctomycetota bacterium]|jgi:RNA 3'-terminal phosphate cyclase (ATP)